jgi:RNA polymerase-binding transcription factor DksA
MHTEALARHRRVLERRRAELERRLHRIEDELDETPDPDFGDRATERAGDEALEELGTAGLAELRAIAAAMDRIEAGTYGDCVRCGEAIEPARLEAVPHTPFCASCARSGPGG